MKVDTKEINSAFKNIKQDLNQTVFESQFEKMAFK